MNKFARLPMPWQNLIVGLAALLLLALLWGASSLAHSYAPQAQAQALAVQLQSEETQQRQADERATVLAARNAARAQWQARVEAARGLAQIGGYALALALGGCTALVALSLAARHWRATVQLPPVRRLPRGALQFPGGAVLDTQTGAQWQIGTPRDPQLQQAQALAALLQARGTPRREALPAAWREVLALEVAHDGAD